MDTAKLIGYGEKTYTIDDIYALPEGKHAELIDGELYMMATPGMVHQRISSYLHNEIYNHIKQNNGDCESFAAPFAVFLNADDKIYLEPDISIVCDKNKLTEEGCKGAPDWIIEIVSPSSRPRDFYKKLVKYGTAGVREYWIVDHEKNHIIVYNFEHDTVEDYSFLDKVKAGIYEDFEIDFSGINIG